MVSRFQNIFFRCSLFLFTCDNHLFTNVFCFLAGEVQCPAIPGRPLICAAPNTPCPSACEDGFSVCGLKRVDGQLVVGSDGRPLPNCVASASATLCNQPSIRPLPSNFTGGSGSGSWDSVRLNGTDSAGANVGSVAEIGSDASPGVPAFFGGNGTDPNIVVKVRKSASKSGC